MESLLIGLAIVAICIFVLGIPHFSNHSGQVKTAEAIVVSRRSERPSATLPTQWGSRMNYVVTFSVDEVPLELNAASSQYARLVEGIRVQLRWQGNTIVDFQEL